MPTDNGASRTCGGSGLLVPLAPGRRQRRAFRGCTQELALVRQWLSSMLPQCRARDDVLSVAVELASNALEHTASGKPGGSFAVEVAGNRSMVHVAVADGGSPCEPQVIEDPDGEHGRGLLLVDGLSARTGWTGDERGRVVWAQIAWPDNAGVIQDPASDRRQMADDGNRAALAQPFEDGAHPAAHCCCHVFTPACPVDCLAAVLSTATFNALARADGAPFDRPATVGRVLELRRAGQLSKAAGLGRRRLSEIDVVLVLSGFAVADATSSRRRLDANRAGSGDDDAGLQRRGADQPK